ncbi:membrane fusion protein, Cu(I)/Ag(I) efflux system [Solimonas aquatica]|uniref:Membrane fusion protein, Cu(I)/Ag(I) efflux system n=1 Tax=Solimonas aquatica TaxID=489703 RepID=A0A1H9DVY6_9GAMM|nr:MULTISPECIES: efflux RND transporter periplasmic adaptor subunit [Solimonas]SEQ17614.1 membrane fusion protein, Cu(I)/Ag(I) efflux system [Solimonas aquatica]
MKNILVITAVALFSAGAGAWMTQHRMTGSAPDTSMKPSSDGHAQPHALVRMTDAQGKPYYTCPMHPQVRQDKPGNCPICGMKLVERVDAPAAPASQERRILYWYDPMMPDQHFKGPGKSPMNMDLIPKYADASPERSTGVVVSIDPRMAQNLGMRTATVTRNATGQGFSAVGSVEIDETRIVAVEARAAGWVEALDVRAVGETVHRGQRLAALYAPEILTAQKELQLARQSGDTALIDGAMTRLKLLGVPGSGSGNTSQRVAIIAPSAGVVTELMVREGAQLAPGTPLMKLADLSRVWIVVQIPETQAAAIKLGSRVEARLRGLPDRHFSGTVDYIYPTLDVSTRTLRARLGFDNADGALKPGMYADVSVAGSGRSDVLLVPSEAVIRTGTRNVVLLAEDAGRYRPVAVQLGAERGNQIEVLAGLADGDHVVVSGQFLIDSEASLLGAYNRMGASSTANVEPAP